MERIILHSDMNNFFASVECLHNPSLREKPMAVCGDPAARHGIVMAKNDLAKSRGVLTGESMFSAKKKCPELVTLKPNYPIYLECAKKARAIYSDYSQKIVPYGMDEAWIDLSGIVENIEQGTKIADEIRQRLHDEIGITASIGVSFNLIFSKLGSDYKKPNATTTFSKENYKQYIWKLPAFDLLFVGRSTRHKLYTHGIISIGDLAQADPFMLTNLLGKLGYMLWQFANGDDSGFNPETKGDEAIKSIGNTITPPRDMKTSDDVEILLYILSGTVASRLKRHNFKAQTICLMIKDSLFNTMTRQRKINIPTQNRMAIYNESLEIFKHAYNWTNPVRSISVRVDNLISTTDEQLSLTAEIEPELDEKSKHIKELIEQRFGNVNIEKGAMLRDLEILNDYKIT